MRATYFRPEKLDAAVQWLSECDARIAAGCTDLFPSTTGQKLDGEILDLTGIGELRGITEDATHWRFGATTTWTDIANAALPDAFNSLKLAAVEVGSIQIQNAGTIGGNLCNASPAADGTPCWLTLNSQVELISINGKRILPLREFVTGPQQIELLEGEIVSAILVPKEAAQGASYFLKLGARKYLVISIAMVAARLVELDGLVLEAAISVGSCNAAAVRLTDLEEELVGKPYTSNLIHLISDRIVQNALNPINDLRSDASYRKTAAVELVKRCIEQLLKREAATP